ncbi:MAG: hypothetical protein KUG77_29960 [Nannocystaceae bacterium]|nr:hypothetical protein [Nannocystaceae bacterium]
MSAVVAEHAQVQAFVSGVGEGADEEAAYKSAQAELAEALLGDARWLTFTSATLHDRAQDPYQAVRTPGGWEVAIGLDEGRTATTLDAMTYAKPTFEGPKEWHDTLYQVLATHAAKLVCERRASLYAVACDASPTQEEDAQLKRLGEDLHLASVVTGGVPTDVDGVVLRPGSILVTWKGAPVEGLPLEIERPDGSRSGTQTNAAGVADLSVAVGSKWPGAFVVRVDGGRMVGPLDSQSAWPSLEVEARTLDARRWALVFEDGMKADDPFAKELRAALREDLGDPVTLDRKAIKALRTVGPAERARVLAVLADAMGGALDVVVLVKAESRFASRAGGSRVWFEASSHVVVHEVWGAGELGRAKVEATASGVGDRRADHAARRELAEKASQRILGVLRPG